MSEKKEISPLDPVAFAFAMIGGPILVTLCTIWIMFIPGFALLIGGIPYLVIGTPLALLMALTGPVTAGRSAIWGAMTIICITAPFAAVTGLMQQGGDAAGVLFIGAVSALFATLWAATSGWIYSGMTTPEPKPN
jgi:hypothetical protein